MNLTTLSASLGTYTATTKKLHGRDHIVVPCTLLVEGVHAGSSGPVLYKAEDLEKYAQNWNGVPVPILHPTKKVKAENGEEQEVALSCNQPEVEDEWGVGRVYNAKYDSDKKALKAELWLEKDRLNTKNARLLSDLEEGKEVEVSTGLFFDKVEQEGTWNGEDYKLVARNYVPDHLALLPGAKGACSCADGCGVRLNQRGEQNMEKPSLLERAKAFFGFALNNAMETLEASLQEKLEAYRALLPQDSAMGVPGVPSYWWSMEAAYDDGTFVACKYGQGKNEYYRAKAELDDKGYPVKLIPNTWEEVRKEINWIPVEKPSLNAEPEPKAPCSCEVNVSAAKKAAAAFKPKNK